MTTGSSQTKPWTGRRVILSFVAFFAALIAVQAAFITIAVSTHTGVVSKQPYRKGLNYGERIKQSEKQQKLGWKEDISFTDNKDRLFLHISNKESAPIGNLILTGVLSRPVHKNEDLVLEFQEDRDGEYSADLKGSKFGSFIVDVAAKQTSSSDEVVWRIRRRLWIKP